MKNQILGQVELAMKDLNRAIELDSTVFEQFLCRGKLYAESGDYAAAIADYDAAIRLSKSDPWPYHSRGIAHTHLGDFTRAIRDFDKALDTEPDFEEARMGRGIAHYLAGVPLNAIPDFNEVIRLGLGDLVARAFGYRAAANTSTGNIHEAQQDAATAIALGLDKEWLDPMLDDAKV